MTYSRMFTATCDECNEDACDGAGFWWKSSLTQMMVSDGWIATKSRVVCPECQS